MATFREDILHSIIEFKIKHLMISTVRGRFHDFSITIYSEEEDFSDARIYCEIKVDSIDTGIKDRDNHLRSHDFFDVEKFDTMNFYSEKITKKSEDGDFEVVGELRIKNESRPVTLKVKYNGQDVDNYNTVKHGFDLEGKIKRSDWSLDFNLPGGKNTLLIGDDVTIDASIQIIKED